MKIIYLFIPITFGLIKCKRNLTILTNVLKSLFLRRQRNAQRGKCDTRSKRNAYFVTYSNIYILQEDGHFVDASDFKH